MSKKKLLGGAAALAAFAIAGSASASVFVNGGFEAGDTSGWTQGGGYRAGVLNPGLSPAYFNGGGGTNDGGRSAITNIGDVDPNVGAAMGSLVQSGKHAVRIEDTTYGGYATYLEQTVASYTDNDIFFAWKSVLLGAHDVDDAATMIITLTDVTTSTELLRREYNAASSGGGVDGRFTLDGGGNFYTAAWQIEHIDLAGLGAVGDTIKLSVLGSDCQPTGHWGYVYLDGFGAVAPPPGPIGGVPEPATWAMLIAGFGMTGAAVRRRRRQGLPAPA